MNLLLKKKQQPHIGENCVEIFCHAKLVHGQNSSSAMDSEASEATRYSDIA